MPTVKSCEQCQAPLPPESAACPNCGRVLSPTSSNQPPAKRALLHQPGKPMPKNAIVGIVAAAISFLVIAATVMLLFPVFNGGQEQLQEGVYDNASYYNLYEIGQATVKYERAHKNRLPPLDSMDHFKAALAKYDKQAPDSLFVEPGTNRPYVLAASLSNKIVSSAGWPADAVIAHEAVPRDVNFGSVYDLYSNGDVLTAVRTR